jgi:hypothetical protein
MPLTGQDFVFQDYTHLLNGQHVGWLGSSNVICSHSLVFCVGNGRSNYEFDPVKKGEVKEEKKEMNKRECDIYGYHSGVSKL